MREHAGKQSGLLIWPDPTDGTWIQTPLLRPEVLVFRVRVFSVLTASGTVINDDHNQDFFRIARSKSCGEGSCDCLVDVFHASVDVLRTSTLTV